MKSTKDIHDSDFRVRLTESDYEWLQVTARRIGLKPAVLARVLLKSAARRLQAGHSFADLMDDSEGADRH